MKNENDLMDSLLKEHARTKGIDEKFLKDLEEKIDAEERGNVIPIDQSASHSDSSPQGLGLWLGLAACTTLCIGGAMLWNSSTRSEAIALDGEAAAEQIEAAKNSVEDFQSGGRAPLEGSQSRDKETKGLVGSESIRAKRMDQGMAESTPGALTLERSKEEDIVRDGAGPVPNTTIAEPSLDYSATGEKNEFGDGGGSNSRKEKSKSLSEKSAMDFASDSAPATARAGVGRSRQGGLMDLDINEEHKDRRRPVEEFNAEQYGKLIENEFTAPVDKESKRSTFAIDVDTASYANVRRLITDGNQVPKDSVRIEEMINYFDYQYAKPDDTSKHPFAVHVDAAACPWNKDNKLVRIALQGKEITRDERPASNVVFLLDVSGSMNRPNKLPLLKESLKYLLEEMNEQDTISIVVYAGASGLALPPTKVDDAGRVKIIKSLENLNAGGSTAGGAGIKLAYKIAQENFIKQGVNRVILATDGDFNVGVSDADALSELVKERAAKGVDVSVLGFGTGNLNDRMLELITNNGNGNYSYIDTIKEGRKVLLEDMMGTLVTIAKDVKIQVEFNPERVKEYRLIGYSNRMLPNAAFLDKRADAGEIGAGHRVTAFYEIVPGKAMDKSKLDDLRYGKKQKADVQSNEAGVDAKHAEELLYVKLAYKQPEQKVNDESTYLSVPVKDNDKGWEQMDDDFKFGSSVALFGMILRESEHNGDGDLRLVTKLAEAGKGADGKGIREEFSKLVRKMEERGKMKRIRQQ